MSNTFSKGGVHPADKKISSNCGIKTFPIPSVAYIPVAQHIGAPAKPIVNVGDIVKVGQPIAEPTGFMSAYIHSSVSGKVKAISVRKDLANRTQTCIEIAVEGDEWLESIDRSEDLVTAIPDDPKLIIDKIKLGGVVGLGGATFPTHVKLTIPQGKKCEMLIINACECEPYLTSDYRTLLERGKEVLVGIAILKKALAVDKAVIGIENNKPEAISYMSSLVQEFKSLGDDYNGISVMSLQTKYPEGGEKQLINAVMGKEVPSMALPIDVGAVVQNVCTSLAVYEAVQKNKPLIDNSITITGDICPVQENLLVRVGTPLEFIIEHIGGYPQDAVKVISGGPMMGRAIANMDTPTVKGTSSLLFMAEGQTKRKPESNCIRCAKCANACPMGLEPYLLSKLSRRNLLEDLENNAVQDCIECGCCSYSCPANIPLLDNIRVAKGQVISIIRNRAAAAAKK